MTATRSQTKKAAESGGAPPPESAPEESRAKPGSKHKTTDREPESSAGGPEPKRTKKESQSPPKTKAVKNENGSAVEAHGRDEEVPSNILEKGIIYFFFRGRVNTGTDGNAPSSVDDIARSFILLRPIAADAKLGSGPIGDAGNSRLLAVPKKVLPQTGRDRWICFVEKAGASFDKLKEEFLSGSEYATKTKGTRHTPAVTPVGEGIYAITTTGRESHLAYMLTLPAKLGEVQTAIGLKEKGSFIISTRNPGYSAPGNARLPKGPEYPKEVLDEFRSLRWMPTLPKHLDYVNSQILLVGESSGIEKALEPQDTKNDVEDPAEEMEKLSEEDAQRMKGLSSDDSSRIFADLEVHAKDYPKLQTTF